jgi:hypothetical protein
LGREECSKAGADEKARQSDNPFFSPRLMSTPMNLTLELRQGARGFTPNTPQSAAHTRTGLLALVRRQQQRRTGAHGSRDYRQSHEPAAIRPLGPLNRFLIELVFFCHVVSLAFG